MSRPHAVPSTAIDASPKGGSTVTIWTDENGVRRGNAADAGAACVTDKSPKGVSASTYRRMVSQLGAPKPLPGFNPQTGEKEYDMDAVEKFNADRKGPGAWHRDITHRTPMRHQVLSEIAAGRFTVEIQDMQVRVLRDGEPFTGTAQNRANTRQFTDLQRAKMIEVPPVGGKVVPTEEGKALLEKWNAEQAEDQKKTA
jgi:hypothetical protein